MANLTMLIEARVESLPGQPREIVIYRPGSFVQWRAMLPVLLDRWPATAKLEEYVVRLFQRQRPGLAESVGLLNVALVVRMAVAQANMPKEKDGDWEWAQEVA